MLPDLRTLEGFDALRKDGYRFSDFDRPQNFKMQAEILDLAIKTISSLTTEPEIVRDAAYLVLDSLFRAPRGFEFFSRFPKEEVVQFCRLAVGSRESNLPLSIVCPVCPDFTHGIGYQLDSGIDTSGESVLANLGMLIQFFEKSNFAIQVAIHLADVEMFDQKVFELSGETQENFLAKTNRTIEKMRDVVRRLGFENTVAVASMINIFAVNNFDYPAQKNINICGIQDGYERKKIKKTFEALVQERLRRSTARGTITEAEYSVIAMNELADYAAFGEFVAGRAVILSSDAKSAIPAYNFLRSGQDGKQVNPTIYVGKAKQGRGEFLYG